MTTAPRSLLAASVQTLAHNLRTSQARALTRYQEDPAAYARDVHRATLTPDQEEIAHRVQAHRRTAVKASHAVGKTWISALLANFWFDCWEEHIVYLTAPTWSQALNLTFKQIVQQRRDRNLPGEILRSGRVRDTDPLREAAHYIRALNAETGEGFQGEHSAPILVILEEAVGVPNYIWEATDGLMTSPDCRLLAVGNPTSDANPFGTACQSPSYETLSISALSHPNIHAALRGKTAPFPKAISLAWLAEMLTNECEEHDRPAEETFPFYPANLLARALAGEPIAHRTERAHYLPSPLFQGRVLGEFPSQPDEQVIPRAWLAHLAQQAPTGVPEIGCDPARFGTDRTAIATRRGPCLTALREIRQLDLHAVTAALAEAAWDAAEAAGCPPQTIPIRVDVTGGLGAGPADTLRAEGYAVIAVNSSEAAREPELYPNRRSELWFEMRERARRRDLDLAAIPGPLREKLMRELATPKWKVGAGGRKVVESKEQIKSRLGQSPDLADAVNLAFSTITATGYRPAAAAVSRGALRRTHYR